MFVMRNGPRGARFASFGLGLCVFALLPTEAGYQDIASLLARQPGVAERWQQRVFSPTVETIQVATFNFVRPIGTSLPRSAAALLASFESQGNNLVGAITRNPLLAPPRRYEASDFPRVDRSMKGDRLHVAAPPAETPEGAPPREPAARFVAPEKTAATPQRALDPELAEALNAPPLAQYDAAAPVDVGPFEDKAAASGFDHPSTLTPSPDPFTVKTASLYFGSDSLGSSGETLRSWQPGEAPMILSPAVPDSDLKATAPGGPAAALSAGENVAGKGEVNADHKARPAAHLETPAERLGLEGKARAKQEKCLAEAVYFEARGEAVRGQIAVAQVVMNRVFSGFYPTTVCGVVYQNANRHLACQFTFACDGIPDVVREPDMWDRARKIAKATLDGQLWLPEVAKSTHYHAYWVHPSWVREMRKMYRTGVHTFYRPRAWGDGSEAPSWGSSASTAEISAKLALVKN
ncbi:MAG: cell wall hydrolase [Xanthobacteraceae bacterium]|nr:cell wall hydrolase [Xanthobacteraceae bacterium]